VLSERHRGIIRRFDHFPDRDPIHGRATVEGAI
jgi:uncharacterized protein (DUF924 family)